MTYILVKSSNGIGAAVENSSAISSTSGGQVNGPSRYLYADGLEGEKFVVHCLEKSHARYQVSYGLAIERSRLQALKEEKQQFIAKIAK